MGPLVSQIAYATEFHYERLTRRVLSSQRDRVILIAGDADFANGLDPLLLAALADQVCSGHLDHSLVCVDVTLTPASPAEFCGRRERMRSVGRDLDVMRSAGAFAVAGLRYDFSCDSLHVSISLCSAFSKSVP